MRVAIGGLSSLPYAGYVLGLSDLGLSDIAPKNRIALFIDPSIGWKYSAETVTVDVDKWSMIAASFDTTSFKLYKNGAKVAETSTTGSVASYNGVRRLGVSAYKGLDQYFNGNIDEVMIFNTKLEDADIQSIYNYFSPTIR